MGFLAGTEAGCIVTAHLERTGTEWSRTVVLARDDVGSGGKSALEVRAYGRDEDQEQVLIGGFHAYLCAGTHQQRTDVERRAALVGRDEAFVQLHDLEHSLTETFGREFGHQDAAAGGLQAGGVLLQAEDAHLAVLALEGLQALEGFLSVVQTGSCHVHGDGFLAAYFQLAPLTVTMVNSHVVVCLHVSEGQI